jgi:uncharacterized protein involved in type VI secretion and phage assembly
MCRQDGLMNKQMIVEAAQAKQLALTESSKRTDKGQYDNQFECINPKKIITDILSMTMGAEALTVVKTKSKEKINDQVKSINVTAQA